MDERIEEIKPISRICPVRKITLAKPRRDRRELMYQLSQNNKNKKPGRNTKKKPDVSKTIDSGSVLNSNDLVADIKKRVAFDRAMTIGDNDEM